MKEHTKRDDYECNLTVLDDPNLGYLNGEGCGGVQIYAQESRIVCSNTLEARLGLSFEGELPKIRKCLFPPTE